MSAYPQITSSWPHPLQAALGRPIDSAINHLMLVIDRGGPALVAADRLLELLALAADRNDEESGVEGFLSWAVLTRIALGLRGDPRQSIRDAAALLMKAFATESLNQSSAYDGATILGERLNFIDDESLMEINR